ncbi:hypothetical protein HanIR_Chr17g0896561 [Helianthus annuus]|nr:hypothetical protein HanIR_Chr17g0896561 [Helianthus annuus]
MLQPVISICLWCIARTYNHQVHPNITGHNLFFVLSFFIIHWVIFIFLILIILRLSKQVSFTGLLTLSLTMACLTTIETSRTTTTSPLRSRPGIATPPPPPLLLTRPTTRCPTA